MATHRHTPWCISASPVALVIAVAIPAASLAPTLRGQEFLPRPGEPVVRTLTTEDAEPAGLVLTLGRDSRARMRPLRDTPRQYWTLSPAGRNLFRLQLFDAGRLWSLSANGPSGEIEMRPSRQQAAQLWRAIPSPTVAGAVAFENVAYPGRFLAGSRDSVVALERGSASAAQNWLLGIGPPAPPPAPVPVVEMVRHVVRPQRPLAPVPTQLVNSHSNTIWVLLRNLSDGSTEQLTIAPRESVEMMLQRDAGATIVEQYQVVTPAGDVYREEFVTPVAPMPLYDVAVYERFLQSIAIDRTGKSPRRIEDVNYQAKGVGVFTIPAGPAFQGGKIDVYALAKRADNAGALPPMRAEQPADERLGPLERTLLEATRSP